MIGTSRWRNAVRGFWGRLVATSLIVLTSGVMVTPAFAAVTVDQTPLTSQVTLPPNIMLLIDDSGSMAWDFMPDSQYLCDVVSGVWTKTTTTRKGTTTSDVTCNATIDMYRSYAINGAYYNPYQIYQPPPTSAGVATGTKSVTVSVGNGKTFTGTVTTWSSAYPPSPSMVAAYDNPYAAFSPSTGGQQSTPTTDDVSTYTSPSLSGASGFSYYTGFFGNSTAGTCSAGYYYSGYGCYTYDGYQFYPQTLNCPSGYVPNISAGSLSSACQKGVSLFTFEEPATTIPTGSTTSITYNSFYVAANSGDCATAEAISSSVTSNNCIDDDATRQNVANWFSYYRTRISMAKSGVMTAFSTLDGSYRVGFASINNGSGGNWTDQSDLTNTVGSSGYSQVSVGSGFNLYLANVAPFNYTYTDTSGNTVTATVNNNTQKANLWTWAAGLSPNNSTPTVSALAAIGQYYAGKGIASGSTTSPWVTMPSDPNYASYKNATFACRASYTILTTDGFWNQNYTGSTVSAQASNSAVKMTSSATGAKYSLAADTPPFAEGYGTNSSGATVSDSTSAPSKTTLADVAFYYWANDLQSTIGDEVPTNSADPAFWQHMTTFTMGLGFSPQTASPASAMANNAANVFAWAQSLNSGNTVSTINSFSWGKAASSSGGIENIVDLAHAGVNGHGGFYSVASPSDFQSGLEDALGRAEQRLGSGASLAANSTQLTTGTDAFQATYYTGTWTGDLKEYSVDPNTGVIAQSPAWSALTLLPPETVATTATPLTAAGRTIYTHDISAGATSGYTSFAISSSGSLPTLSVTQLANLGSTTAAQASMINYLRGDASNEQRNKGSYRNRTTVLGDIVDSQPVYEGAPNANTFYGQTFLGSSTYASFVSTEASRKAVVWVAANDGMLHGFDAATGLEVYAYLPGAVLNDKTNPISNLANPLYGTSTTVPHAFFNDGMLTVADAYDGASWHTVLVGTTGRGTAKAVYALDVTDPTKVSFLWERSAGDNVDSNSQYIGQITGQPVIAQTGSAKGEWSVLIGNGYNSPNGTAALLQFDLFTGALTVHTTTNNSTTNYNVASNMSTDTTTNNFTLTTSTTTTAGNGLAAPAVWEDSATNGISTKAWAGDLNGAVWQFTLNNIDGNGGTDDPTPSSAGTQVFQATDASGNVQPITSGMLAGEDPTTTNVWLFFGTGRYLTSADWSNLAGQSWYGVIAENNSGTPLTCSTATSGNGCGERSALVQRQIISEQAATTSTSAARVITTSDTATPVNDTVNGGQNYQGWYLDLQEPQPNTSGPDGGDLADLQGERIVTPNQFEGNLLLATTRLPLAADPCNPSGSGWIMAISPFTGTNPSTEFFDLNGDGAVNSSDTVNAKPAGGIGFSSLPNNPIFAGTAMMVSFNNGSNGSIATKGGGGLATRVSWRELINQ